MPPTGRPGSIPAKRCTDWRAIARIIAWSPPSSACINRWAISSAVRASSAATGRPAPVALAGLVLHLSPQLVELALVGIEQAVLRTTQAEVHLEHRFERPPVAVVLDQRGAEGVLERVAVVDRDVLHRLHRVEVLGEAHRQPGVAQLDDEPVEQLEHASSWADVDRVGHCRQATSP